MNKKWKGFLASSLLLLTACSNASSGTVEEVIDAQEEFGCNVINVYNTGEYIGDDVIPNFEKMYNAKVNYDLFESNEIMYTKLLGGSSYDVLVPSDYSIERLIEEGRIQPLDLESMENIDAISSDVREMQKVFDPEQIYSVPYFWGSVGLIYNQNNVDPAVIEEKGWDILLDETYRDRVFMYDSQRDAFMVAFKALGYSMNTDNDAEIQQAYQWLRKMDQAVHPSYVTDEVIDAMVNGEKDIALVYSGDAAYIISENEDMAFIEPYQGTNIWVDALVVPSNATCPGLANAFIDYVTGYEPAYSNSETVGYTATNQEVFEELSSEGGLYYENPAYIPRSGYEHDEVFRYNEILRQKLSDLWNKVKIGE